MLKAAWSLPPGDTFEEWDSFDFLAVSNMFTMKKTPKGKLGNTPKPKFGWLTTQKWPNSLNLWALDIFQQPRVVSGRAKMQFPRPTVVNPIVTISNQAFPIWFLMSKIGNGKMRYHLVIWHSYGKSLINGGFNGKINQRVYLHYSQPGQIWVMNATVYIYIYVCISRAQIWGHRKRFSPTKSTMLVSFS